MKRLIKKLKDFFRKLFCKKQTEQQAAQTAPTEAVVQPTQPTPTVTPTVQPVASQPFTFVSFGSPNCSKAVEDPKVQIKDLKWSKSQLSYKWATKTKLDGWGISDPHDHSGALACFGYLDKNGVWRFCKIDWISSDRLTRDMHNVDDGYNGINAKDYYAAKAHGFFIMEKNGKRRTNILTV